MKKLHVIFKLAEAEYAISGEEVFQMNSYEGAVPVPGASAYMLGLMHVRQQIVPVMDLRLRFGMLQQAPTLDSRVIVLKMQERLVGLLVDSAREVQALDETQLQNAPELTRRQSDGFIKSVVQLNQRTIMVLDPKKVVGEENLNG